MDLTGVVGRNRVKAALTTGNQSFSSDYVNHRPVIEVETHPTDFLVEAEPTGTYEVEVGYTVTFTNTTDANGSSSDIVLRPGVPAGFSLKSVTGTGTRGGSARTAMPFRTTAPCTCAPVIPWTPTRQPR